MRDWKFKVMIKAVIFDFDGIIVDAEKLNSKAYETVLKEYGKRPMLNNEVVHVVGMKGEKNWEILKKKYNIDEDIQVLYKKKREIQNLLFPQAKLMPGIQDALKRLKRVKDLKLAVATMSPLKVVNLIFNKFKMGGTFNAILTVENCSIFKPHPDIYLRTAKILNIAPDQCMVVEDSEIGVEAGKRAGMYVVAVPNKYTKGQDFSKADFVVKKFTGLSNILLKGRFTKGG